PSEDTKAPRLRLAGASRLSLDGAEVHGSIFIEDAPGGLDMRQGAADSIGLTGHTRLVLDGVQAAVEGLSLSAPRIAVRAHTGPVRIGTCVVDAGAEPLEPSAIAVDGLDGKLTVAPAIAGSRSRTPTTPRRPSRCKACSVRRSPRSQAPSR
ncbi:MAG: hypothetical protein JNJ59_23605, partial [Deltaproteobacteria bacterium]|nr:hypothetical protein [Deltaproteobacteria bacterium]